MARKVTVVSTRDGGKKEVMSSASTWGDLKNDLESNGISTSDMKAMERATKVTYEKADAVLPTGEFVIFLTTGKKMKSGK